MKLIKLLVAIGYGFSLSYLVFFARRRRHLDERFLNLIPIRNTVKEFVMLDTNSIKDLYNYYSNLVGNILLFIPLPLILAAFSKKKDNKNILLLAVSLSIFIELMQYVFKIGVADIDDVLLNTLGAVVGIGLLKLKDNFRHSRL